MAAPSLTLLCRSAAARMVFVLVLIAALWLVIGWAVVLP
jgi:hypothetical protein